MGTGVGHDFGGRGLSNLGAPSTPHTGRRPIRRVSTKGDNVAHASTDGARNSPDTTSTMGEHGIAGDVANEGSIPSVYVRTRHTGADTGSASSGPGGKSGAAQNSTTTEWGRRMEFPFVEGGSTLVIGRHSRSIPGGTGVGRTLPPGDNTKGNDGKCVLTTTLFRKNSTHIIHAVLVPGRRLVQEYRTGAMGGGNGTPRR